MRKTVVVVFLVTSSSSSSVEHGQQPATRATGDKRDNVFEKARKKLHLTRLLHVRGGHISDKLIAWAFVFCPHMDTQTSRAYVYVSEVGPPKLRYLSQNYTNVLQVFASLFLEFSSACHELKKYIRNLDFDFHVAHPSYHTTFKVRNFNKGAKAYFFSLTLGRTTKVGAPREF